MSYHDDLFPIGISYGARGGPQFSTTVLELASGYEKRNINWSKVKARYNVAHGVRTPEQMAELLNFFYARYGKAYTFPFLDHQDHKIVNQQLGIGDGATTSFQIYKRYQSKTYFYDRLITKLRPDTIGNVTVDGVPYVLDSDDDNGYSLDMLSGQVVFKVAPITDAVIVLTYIEFYVHVRFDVDYMDIQLVTYRAESWTDIFLVEVKEN